MHSLIPYPRPPPTAIFFSRRLSIFAPPAISFSLPVPSLASPLANALPCHHPPTIASLHPLRWRREAQVRSSHAGGTGEAQHLTRSVTLARSAVDHPSPFLRSPPLASATATPKSGRIWDITMVVAQWQARELVVRHGMRWSACNALMDDGGAGGQGGTV